MADSSLESFKKDAARQSWRGQGPITIELLLGDSVNLKFFKEFCIQEMSVENLLFWLEVQDYKTTEAPGYRRMIARKIFQKYVRADAPMGIAVQDRTRREVADGYQRGGEPDPTLFDGLATEVVMSMKLDILPRFLESKMYSELLELRFEDRRVIDMQEFDLYRFLGAGGFGMVLLARKRDNQKFYAIKVIDKRILISQNQTHSIYREKEVLACVEHPYIVSLRYGFQTEDHLCLVLDYIEGGNMYSDLMRGPYTHERACFYAAQIVLATQHLHELDILYRDLKPDNVLLTLNGEVKLADMGAARGIEEDGTIKSGDLGTATSSRTAKQVDPNKARRMTITGTHGYRAPEVYERDYGKAADWWNVGILIVEMLTAENPLRGENRRESEHLTKTKEIAHVLPSFLRAEAKEVALAFLTRDPTKRLGCGEAGVPEIKVHPFFAPIDWDKLMAQEMPVPFEMDLEYERPARQPVPKEYGNQLDYFCQMVDYMKTSMSMRGTWPLKPTDQKVFDGFDYVSNKVWEDELTRAYNEQSAAGGDMFGGMAAGKP
jgi:serine/threonine protein kinase